MIIDETFMWLYAAYKVGLGCGVVTAACGFSTAICFLAAIEQKLSLKPAAVLAVLAAVSGFVTVMTPSFEEVKAYAFYRIGSDVVDSDAAKQLLDATMKVLENKGSK